MALLAEHEVLLEDVVLAGALEEGAVARAVAAFLGEVGDEVPLHPPAAHRHDVEDRDGPVGVARPGVEEGVVAMSAAAARTVGLFAKAVSSAAWRSEIGRAHV